MILLAQDTLHTYGGDLILQKVFETISSVFYSDSTFKGILKLALTLGGFCCLCLAFFRQKFDPLFRTFLLPALVVLGFLFIPKTSIDIRDPIRGRRERVENVPFFLGKFASVTSEGFYQLEVLLTRGKEDAYRWTDAIYKGENPLVSSLEDKTLEDNFREFCRECVFRDIGLGLYTKNELGESLDALEFLGERTSALRTMVYREEGVRGPVSCREAMEKMRPLFARQAKIQAKKSPLIKPLFEEGGQDAETLIRQRIAAHFLKGKTGVSNGVAGSLGMALIAMRAFLEAALYLGFPLVIALSLLSFGARILLHWLKLVLWVSTWPIFYIALNLFLNAVWKYRAEPLFTLAKADGLLDLYRSMEMIACAALICIPILSWLLLKQSASQIGRLVLSFTRSSDTPCVAPKR